MTPRQLCALLVSLGLLVATPVCAQGLSGQGPRRTPESMQPQLPSPPDGFEWRFFKNTVLPVPPQWHGHEKSGSYGNIPILVYAASPEEFSESKEFEMGLTIQIISGSRRLREIDAKKMAMIYLKPFLETHKKEEILMLEQSTKGDFERTFFRYRDAPAGLKPIIVHKFIMANNVTDAVHVFTFESPEDAWQENWTKFGTPILSKVIVIPTASPN